MSDGTTSIEQLPTNSEVNSQKTKPVQPLQNLGEQNVKIENYGQQLNAERNIDPVVQQIDYNSQLNSVLKEAAASGATVLPSRDIPQNTLPLQQDQQIKPNFVPNTDSDYIGNILDKEKLLQENQKKQNQSDNMDYIYQQLQIPILVGIIYFLFQLPVIRKYVIAFLPNLFNKDGSPNLSGYIFNSIIFALFYTLLIKGLNYLN